MTSQVLAFFYLNDLDHFIKEFLKIKYYVRYQDDFLLFHPSKAYLKYCFVKIKKFLDKENLTLNQKSRLYKCTDNFIFLGRNKKGKYSRYRTIKRRLKKKSFYITIRKYQLQVYLVALFLINFYVRIINKYYKRWQNICHPKTVLQYIPFRD